MLPHRERDDVDTLVDTLTGRVKLTPVAPAAPAGDGAAEADVAAAEAGSNLIGCVVDRVIDSTFSTIVMLATPGGARLRHELEKDEWAAIESRGARPGGYLTIAVDPSAVMPLRDVAGGGAR